MNLFNLEWNLQTLPSYVHKFFILSLLKCTFKNKGLSRM